MPIICNVWQIHSGAKSNGLLPSLKRFQHIGVKVSPDKSNHWHFYSLHNSFLSRRLLFKVATQVESATRNGLNSCSMLFDESDSAFGLTAGKLQEQCFFDGTGHVNGGY